MCRRDDYPPYENDDGEENPDLIWVCKKCGEDDQIAVISLVPRSQGTGLLVGATLDDALTTCSYDTGWDESFWESETVTGYECRNCSPGVEVKELSDLVTTLRLWHATRDPVEVYGTPEHEAWLIEMERTGDYQ